MAVLTGATLAQVGEFSFVLLRAAAGTSLADVGGEALLVAIILSLAVTPIIIALGPASGGGCRTDPVAESAARRAGAGRGGAMNGR